MQLTDTLLRSSRLVLVPHIDGQWRDHILSSLINEAYV